MELVWWHWLALGLLLIGSELLLPAFYLIWFGLGALLTGLVVALVPLGMTGPVGSVERGFHGHGRGLDEILPQIPIAPMRVRQRKAPWAWWAWLHAMWAN